MRALSVVSVAVLFASACHRNPASGTTPAPASDAELADYDLATADRSWAGWTAKGAAGSTVALRGGSVRIHPIAPGRAFDVELNHGYQDLARLKESLTHAEVAGAGRLKIT